ncbi:DUF4190 domain-containing protein [bacterium]|nr:DUF4190 domain-containing protein [bacterium]
MTDSADTQPEVHFSTNNEDLLEYKELSRLAIIAMVLGIFSILSLFTAVLLPVPVVAIVLGLVAYYQIDKSEVLTGKGMALTGIGLAAVWLGLSLTQAIVSDRMLSSESQEMAESWLKVFAEHKIEEAYQLSLPPQARQSEDVSLLEYYAKNQDANEQLEMFKQNPAVDAFVKWEGGPLEVHFVRTLSTDQADGEDYCSQSFQIVDKDSGKPLWDMDVTMKRILGYGEITNEYFWQGQSINLVKTYPAPKK